MESDSQPLLSSGAEQETTPLYGDVRPSKKFRMFQIGLSALCVSLILLNFILAIVHGVKDGKNGIATALMGTSLVGFAIVEVLLLYFRSKGELEIGSWFIYLFAFVLVLQSIFVNVQFINIH